MIVQQILDLLGSIVSFEYHTISDDVNHSYEVKGLVIGVGIELNEKHSISIRDFEDSEDSYQIARMKNFKCVQLDPYAFFENVKSGIIKIEI